MKEEKNEKATFVGLSIFAAIATVVWCHYLGGTDFNRFSLALITCCASFAVGSLFGFLFTIFGDEIGSFGKIQNAVVAAASGVVGVGIAKISDVGKALGQLQLFGTSSAASYWFSTLVVLSYFLAGFYFMYLLRKLVLNPALAQSRAEMSRIELSGSAEDAATEVAKILTPAVLLGREYIGDVVLAGGSQAKALQDQLYSDAVSKFLDRCEQDITSGVEIPPDNITRAAVIHYYRAYFQKEGTPERDKQLQLAESWLSRALLHDSTDLGLYIKLADIYGMEGRYSEAVGFLQRLEQDPTAPQFVQQWLGYYLLFVDGQEQEAIRQSLDFHKRFPGETGGIFNASCGFAQLYAIEVHKKQMTDKTVTAIPASKNRRRSLDLLRRAVEIDPAARAQARKYAVPGESFETLADDKDFQKIIEEPQALGPIPPPKPLAPVPSTA
jgi:tetratricopeptide (TPR) repeat protein